MQSCCSYLRVSVGVTIISRQQQVVDLPLDCIFSALLKSNIFYYIIFLKIFQEFYFNIMGILYYLMNFVLCIEKQYSKRGFQASPGCLWRPWHTHKVKNSVFRGYWSGKQLQNADGEQLLWSHFEHNVCNADLSVIN